MSVAAYFLIAAKDFGGMNMDFEKMTVLELRKVAKDMNVKLGAGISKQGIVDKLNAVSSLNRQEEAQEPAQPVRHASIITDDEFEENEVNPASYSRPVRPTMPRPAGQNGASSLSTISAKAPAFTMEGSRAWHNPRSYNTPYQRPAAAPGWNQPQPRQLQEARPQNTYGQTGYNAPRPAAPQQQPRPQQTRPSYQRFGPENEAGSYARQDYAAPRQEYTSPQQPAQPRGDWGAYRADYAAPQQQPPVRETAPNEILMTGECGDCQGVLEVLPDGFGFIRMNGLLAGKSDVYVGNVQVKRYGLRTGDYIAGKTHPQRDMDRNNALLYITEVNGQEPEEKNTRPAFEELTAIYPKRKLNLSARIKDDVFLRSMDLLSPIALGQRALFSVSPQVNGNLLLSRLSHAVSAAAPKARVMTLLLDERPEEVTEAAEAIKGETYAATFDLPAEMTVKTAEMVLEMAQRQVEQKKDVILLVNSLTRLARACNTAAPQTARLLPNGLVSGGLTRAKRFFAAARNTREGGSLTIIALQEVNGKNPLDEVIAAEMENTANLSAALLPGDEDVSFVPDAASCHARRSELVLTQEEMQASAKAKAVLNGRTDKESLQLIREMVMGSADHEALVQQLLALN